ncbi:MAG: hypothetical protein B7Y83_10330 [Flavobacteriales bacterium 32-34-25]|nr:MAG: hypothetical protein B7Y83_10330 [Flavobacteriales bacterium 32-34-25]
MDHSKLHLEQDMDIIIPRAMYATVPGTFEANIEKLELYYSKEDILYHLQNTKEGISNKVCELVAIRYGVKKFARFKL